MLNSIDNKYESYSYSSDEEDSSSGQEIIGICARLELRKYAIYHDLVDAININNQYLLPENTIYQIIDSYVDRKAREDAAEYGANLVSEDKINEMRAHILFDNNHQTRSNILTGILQDLRRAEKEYNVLEVPESFSIDNSSDDDSSYEGYPLAEHDSSDDDFSEHPSSTCPITICHFVKDNLLFQIGCASSTAVCLAYYADVSPLVAVGSAVIGVGLKYLATQAERESNVFAAR